MKKRVILVKPPEKSYLNFGTFSLGVLAAAIRDLAYVSIIDATNLTLEDTVDKIILHRPELVGITVMGLPSVYPAIALIEILRKKSKINSTKLKLPTIIVGGHGASMTVEHLLKNGADAVVIGEGELIFGQILKYGIRTGSPGLACLLNDKIIVGPKQMLIRPLDKLNFPARDLMPPPPNGVFLMETSRGCPHNCGFCETTRFYGQIWRPHSPDRVLAEVRQLVNRYNAWIIHFADDNFIVNRRRLLEICKRLSKIQLPAFIMVSARADDLISSPEIIPAMASARILRVTVGVETLESDLSVIINKPISIEVYREIFKRMREFGIFSVASFIIGLPYETGDMRRRTLDLAIATGSDSVHFLPFLPLPGIPLQSNKGLYDPDPADVRDANVLNHNFRQNKIIHKRLESAVQSGGIRGLLAKATLNHNDSIC
jgi:anaerobic magnesium-protoporphyrin IX monomethyl ester cyclase